MRRRHGAPARSGMEAFSTGLGDLAFNSLFVFLAIMLQMVVKEKEEYRRRLFELARVEDQAASAASADEQSIVATVAIDEEGKVTLDGHSVPSAGAANDAFAALEPQLQQLSMGAIRLQVAASAPFQSYAQLHTGISASGRRVLIEGQVGREAVKR